MSVEYKSYGFIFLHVKDLSGISERWVLQATYYVNMQVRKSSGFYAGCNLLCTVHFVLQQRLSRLESRSIMW